MNKIRGTEHIHYIQYGKGPDLVLLHGWGQNIEMMKPLGDLFQDKFRVTILDLPGFGSSKEPSEVMTIYEYEEQIESLLDFLEIENPILMGHSFGGRLSIIYASKKKTAKLVLFGSPCIRHQRAPSMKEKLLKTMKKMPLMDQLGESMKKHIGSRDYRSASPVMRQILVETVNEDLTECAKKITCPTLLIWGDQDMEAPIEEAKELEQLMMDAGLITLPGGTHYAYLEFLPNISAILHNFL